MFLVFNVRQVAENKHKPITKNIKTKTHKRGSMGSNVKEGENNKLYRKRDKQIQTVKTNNTIRDSKHLHK